MQGFTIELDSLANAQEMHQWTPIKQDVLEDPHKLVTWLDKWWYTARAKGEYPVLRVARRPAAREDGRWVEGASLVVILAEKVIRLTESDRLSKALKSLPKSYKHILDMNIDKIAGLAVTGMVMISRSMDDVLFTIDPSKYVRTFKTTYQSVRDVHSLMTWRQIELLRDFYCL